MPSLAFDLDLSGLDELVEELKDLDQTVEAGLMATGDAAAYAEVWEWGNARQTKQGPKTVMGVNPAGESVWLSKQAPTGYIAVHTDKYLEIVRAEISRMALSGGTGAKEELQAVVHRSMEQIKEVVSEHAPVDSGKLRDCFQVLDDGDPELGGDPGGTMESRFSRVLNIR
jgi:hypothetical protein